MHTLDIIINASVSIAAAFIGAWFGAKFAAKRNEKAQAVLLQRLAETNNSLAAIARRSPGGLAYAAVKEAERKIGRDRTQENAS